MPKSKKTQKISFNWKIAGEAGEGVMLAGNVLGKALKRHGLYAFNYLEYPSLIRGDHQTAQVSCSDEEIYSQRKKLDLLVSFDKKGFDIHDDEITRSTYIVYNTDKKELTDQEKKELKTKKIIELPIYSIAKETTGKQLASNIVSLGITAYLMGMDKKIFLEVLEDQFSSKGDKIVNSNIKAFEAGYQEASEAADPMIKKIKTNKDKQIFINGNEAVGMGAMAAGLEFYCAYPMTPATGLLHVLAAAQDKYPIVVKHPEDEIAAINQTLGASVAGARAMTGTSGGGYALMNEAVSFAGVAEIPIVIHEAQRTGPASGLPTWTAQADLAFVLNSGHGDFIKVVLTPGTVAEHFELARNSFDLAEKYQIPVIILSDKYILESHQTMTEPEVSYDAEKKGLVDEKDLPKDDSYRRYKLTKSGISPRSIPGQAHGLGITNSYEHDEFGYATEEIEMTVAQVDKRAKKMKALMKEIPQPKLVGPKKAAITFVSWGSTINVLKDLINEGVDANAIHIPCMKPFPAKKFKKLTDKAKKLVMIEGNQGGQGEKHIRMETGVTFDDHIRRYDGRPFYVSDLVKYVKKETK